MRFIAKAVFAIAATGILAGQSTQQPLTYAAVSNITSTSTVIDNRSSFTRQSDYHGFCATGSGTWSATIQYSDVSSAGPWITFPYGTTAVTNASTTCYGYSFTYKPYIRFLIVGTVSVNYTGMKSFWLPVVQSVSSLAANAPLVYSSGTLSIPVATGSVNGYLSSADWGTFNSKENTLTFSSPLVRSTNTITLPSFPWASLSGVPSTLAKTDQVNTYSSGQKQLFTPSGTTAGFNFGAASSAPSSASNGDSYFDTTLLSSRVYVTSAWRSHLIAPVSGTGFLKWDGTATTAASILNAELPAAFDISSNTSTAPVKAGTTLPGTCSTPQLFFDTDATAGQNLFACTSTNTWTLQSGGGGSGILTQKTGTGDPNVDGETCAVPSTSVATTYYETVTQDIWDCTAVNTWKKRILTTNTGVFTETGETSGTPPTAPASGLGTMQFGSSTLEYIPNGGSVSRTVIPKDCPALVAGQVVSAIGANGVITCVTPAGAATDNSITGWIMGVPSIAQNCASTCTLWNPAGSSNGGSAYRFTPVGAKSTSLRWWAALAGTVGGAVMAGIYDTSNNSAWVAACISAVATTASETTGAKSLAWASGSMVSGGTCTLDLTKPYALVLGAQGPNSLQSSVINTSVDASTLVYIGDGANITTGSGSGLAFAGSLGSSNFAGTAGVGFAIQTFFGAR